MRTSEVQAATHTTTAHHRYFVLNSNNSSEHAEHVAALIAVAVVLRAKVGLCLETERVDGAEQTRQLHECCLHVVSRTNLRARLSAWMGPDAKVTSTWQHAGRILLLPSIFIASSMHHCLLTANQGGFAPSMLCRRSRQHAQQ